VGVTADARGSHQENEQPPPGTIGGAPTLDVLRGTGPAAPTTDPIVVGVGRAYNGRIELVAYDSKLGLCFSIDRPRLGVAAGTCPGHDELVPQGGIRVELTGASTSRPRGGYSEIAGVAMPTASSIQVFGRRRGRTRRGPAILATPSSELLDHLNQNDPFTLFAGTMRNCVESKRMRVIARDTYGALVGADRGLRAGRYCGRN
jgi:hypothetical protein